MAIYYDIIRYLVFALEIGDCSFLSVSEYLAEFTDLLMYSIKFQIICNL